MAVASRLVTVRGSVGRDDTWCISGWKSQRVDVSEEGCISRRVYQRLGARIMHNSLLPRT